MAREQANLRLDIWTDQDWRDLSASEQWLYMLLLSHPSLSYAGVADWRPGRLAALSGSTGRADVERIGQMLQGKKFILIDEETEEVLVRSFLKHDGVLKQPKLSVSMVNAFGEIASVSIRKVIIHELHKVRDRHPDWRGIQHDRVVALMDQPAAPIEEFTHSVTPGFTPELTHSFTPDLTHGFTPNGDQGQALRTATATSTSTSPPKGGERGSGGKQTKKPARPLPPDWQPTDEHQQRAHTNGVDLNREAEQFRLHAEANDRRCVNWNSAFTMWLNKAQDHAGSRPRLTGPERQHQISAERHERITQGQFGPRPEVENDPALWMPRQIEEA
ncbi:hypothetical protein [Nesterenkonia sp. K-15-9-6]|uniref:hypothetical protein n=1 Tax=Nesterenkonia sp. K-15-9-6 TaxID=3093918 RepID=UPI0040440BDD